MPLKRLPGVRRGKVAITNVSRLGRDKASAVSTRRTMDGYTAREKWDMPRSFGKAGVLRSRLLSSHGQEDRAGRWVYTAGLFGTLSNRQVLSRRSIHEIRVDQTDKRRKLTSTRKQSKQILLDLGVTKISTVDT